MIEFAFYNHVAIFWRVKFMNFTVVYVYSFTDFVLFLPIYNPFFSCLEDKDAAQEIGFGSLKMVSKNKYIHTKFS